MTTTQPNYLSYLLRLWRVNEDNGVQSTLNKAMWRASLENPHTGQRKGFASLEELFDFLQEETGTLHQTAFPTRR